MKVDVTIIYIPEEKEKPFLGLQNYPSGKPVPRPGEILHVALRFNYSEGSSNRMRNQFLLLNKMVANSKSVTEQM